MSYPPYQEKQPGAPAGPVYQQPPPPPHAGQGTAPPYNPPVADYTASRGFQPAQPQMYYAQPPHQQQYYAQQPYYPPQPGVQYVYVQQDPRVSHAAAGGALGCLSAMLASLCCFGLIF
ncbi:hypothetical protein GGI20_005418 [Coemansia sp. BCRC 34301]|nr:hypothetical protein GGI20_005418 [Coemansia sp. BCRC 34301]